jgi:hypothetical protein
MPARVVLERRRIGGAADLLPQRQLLVEPPALLRLRRLHRPARRDEVEVVLERGALPRDLRTVRLAPHAEADPLEHVLDLGFPDRDLAQQVLGVEAVRPGSIARHVAGRGRVREQRVAGGVHLRQALLIDALEVAERIVAAGVQDDHVHRGARPAQPLQQAVDLDALPLNVRDRLDLRVDRQRSCATRAGRRARRSRTGRRSCASPPPPRATARRRPSGPARVGLQRHREAEGAEGAAHRPRVVHGVAERRVLVPAVADDERDLG